MGDKGRRIAIVDIGTVSSRLLIAELGERGIVQLDKRTVITDLGEGVDATGRFSGAAVARVVDACRLFAEYIVEAGASRTSLTLTSAARDASNGAELLNALRELGFIPQVIPGEIEAKLTFFGVAHDFPGERIVVADSGGGSTELVTGRFVPGRELEMEEIRSFDIGCRRVTERFMPDAPVDPRAMGAAAAFAREGFAEYWDTFTASAGSRPSRLVAVGGTVTTLSAMAQGMKVYDSHKVHLSELTLEQVATAIDRMAPLSTQEIAALPGIQPKRAPVLLAGAVIIGELLRSGGYSALTVSENSLMAGMAETVAELERGCEPSIGWTPQLSC